VRALLTLIKRQIVDNAVYFLAATIFSIVLIIAIISISLSEDITYLSLYTVILIVLTPILFGIGSYILGVIQTSSDKTSGVTSLLSVLSVTHGRIFLARLTIGTLVILTLLGPLAITGAILWKFLGPPDWLFHNWLPDTFIGLSLASLVCYCLGLIAARRADTFASALRALPLVPILMLLIVIKGFGWPLLAMLLPLLALLLLCCLKYNSNRLMINITAGFMALALLAIPLYFGRYFCDGSLATKMDATATVRPSGLLPPEIENDPNVDNHSEAYSRINFRYHYRGIVHNILGGSRNYKLSYILENLGITEYFRFKKRRIRGIYFPRGAYANPIYLFHIDNIEGQFIYRCKSIDSYADEYTWQWKDAKELYFGPKGISDAPDNKLGRFGLPIVYTYIESTSYRPDSPPLCVVYDTNSQCFFAIDFKNQTVHKGHEVNGIPFCPIKVSSLADSIRLDVGFSKTFNEYGHRIRMGVLTRNGYLSVINESGQIYLLDPNTLELNGPAGYLPRPKILFGRASAKPIDLLDYGVDLVAVVPYEEQSTYYGNFPVYRQTNRKGEYLGLVAGSLSRQGMWASVAVFDKDGKKIKSADSKSTLFNVPGGPALTITKYIFESMHPPVLALASFLTAYSFDARSTHRALFLMPNSFVAMARDYEGNIFYMFLLVLLLMLPGIMFAALLAWRVARDASIIGLSNNTRRFWLAETLVFGLVGYIMYRLTRPKVTLVTCANCGKLRRPDADICHHCGSKWDVPELTPPAWRVADGNIKNRASGYQGIR
jgi:hypothetical protein